MSASPGIGVVLAQGNLGDALALGLLLALAGILALAGAGVALALRRWARHQEPMRTFTLQDLREMRARGQITEQEFAALRAEVLSRVNLPSVASARGESAAGESVADQDES